MNITLPIVDTIIVKPLDPKFCSCDEKQKVLTWRNTLLRQVESYIDNIILILLK